MQARRGAGCAVVCPRPQQPCTPTQRWLARLRALACAGLPACKQPRHRRRPCNPATGRPQALVARACLPPILAALAVHEGEAEVASKALILLGVLAQVRWRFWLQGTEGGVHRVCLRGPGLCETGERRMASADQSSKRGAGSAPRLPWPPSRATRRRTRPSGAPLLSARPSRAWWPACCAGWAPKSERGAGAAGQPPAAGCWGLLEPAAPAVLARRLVRGTLDPWSRARSHHARAPGCPPAPPCLGSAARTCCGQRCLPWRWWPATPRPATWRI